MQYANKEFKKNEYNRYRWFKGEPIRVQQNKGLFFRYNRLKTL